MSKFFANITFIIFYPVWLVAKFFFEIGWYLLLWNDKLFGKRKDTDWLGNPPQLQCVRCFNLMPFAEYKTHLCKDLYE